jgi:predicted MPP superfamily phosphohydrolase
MEIGVAAILSFAVLILLGGSWLQTTTYEIRSSRIPASFDGYCIVQVSDLHKQHFGERQVRLTRAIRNARPDLIAITGDLTYLGSWNAEDIKYLARELTEIAPVYFVSGNHDVLHGHLENLQKYLEISGIGVLEGEVTAISRGTDSIVIAGIQDPGVLRRQGGKGKTIDRWKAALTSLRDSLDDRYTVLLSHRPEFFEQYADLGFDLVLAGHAHGGQIRLPFVGALYAPDQGWLPRYASGIHARGGTRMIVSRGLGNSWFPIRFLNRPELVVVRLSKQPD